jgi:uncharacterized protein
MAFSPSGITLQGNAVIRFTSMIRNSAACISLLLLVAPGAVQAQFSESYTFLKAVREGDAAKVLEYINKPGSTLVNARDISTGETALHITTARRDASWMNYLLSRGANANATDGQGLTPLMLATQLHYTEGVDLLLKNGAQVDKPVNGGETALIRAVQLRDAPMIRLLVSKGANADKRDLTGLSARDYAARDSRGAAMLEALESAKPIKTPSGAVQGPKL